MVAPVLKAFVVLWYVRIKRAYQQLQTPHNSEQRCGPRLVEAERLAEASTLARLLVLMIYNHLNETAQTITT